MLDNGASSRPAGVYRVSPFTTTPSKVSLSGSINLYGPTAIAWAECPGSTSVTAPGCLYISTSQPVGSSGFYGGYLQLAAGGGLVSGTGLTAINLPQGVTALSASNPDSASPTLLLDVPSTSTSPASLQSFTVNTPSTAPVQVTTAPASSIASLATWGADTAGPYEGEASTGVSYPAPTNGIYPPTPASPATPPGGTASTAVAFVNPAAGTLESIQLTPGSTPVVLAGPGAAASTNAATTPGAVACNAANALVNPIAVTYHGVPGTFYVLQGPSLGGQGGNTVAKVETYPFLPQPGDCQVSTPVGSQQLLGAGNVNLAAGTVGPAANATWGLAVSAGTVYTATSASIAQLQATSLTTGATGAPYGSIGTSASYIQMLGVHAGVAYMDGYTTLYTAPLSTGIGTVLWKPPQAPEAAVLGSNGDVYVATLPATGSTQDALFQVTPTGAVSQLGLLPGGFTGDIGAGATSLYFGDTNTGSVTSGYSSPIATIDSASYSSLQAGTATATVALSKLGLSSVLRGQSVPTTIPSAIWNQSSNPSSIAVAGSMLYLYSYPSASNGTATNVTAVNTTTGAVSVAVGGLGVTQGGSLNGVGVNAGFYGLTGLVADGGQLLALDNYAPTPTIRNLTMAAPLPSTEPQQYSISSVVAAGNYPVPVTSSAVQSTPNQGSVGAPIGLTISGSTAYSVQTYTGQYSGGPYYQPAVVGNALANPNGGLWPQNLLPVSQGGAPNAQSSLAGVTNDTSSMYYTSIASGAARSDIYTTPLGGTTTGALWVDPTGNALTATVMGPSNTLFAADQAKTLYAIDTNSGASQVAATLPCSPDQLAAGASSLWFTCVSGATDVLYQLPLTSAGFAIGSPVSVPLGTSLPANNVALVSAGSYLFAEPGGTYSGLSTGTAGNASTPWVSPEVVQIVKPTAAVPTAAVSTVAGGPTSTWTFNGLATANNGQTTAGGTLFATNVNNGYLYDLG